MKEDVQEFVVRIPPRNPNKSYHVMKFNANMKVDVGKWNQVRMVRENNRKDPSGILGVEQPKFGAGSEFGREQREEARRRRFGAGPRKYDPDMQPWLMRVGNKKEGKHYKGAREGGVSENTTYYVFTHAQDGAFEAHPIKEWYNFTPRVMYKTLSSEEAEERFAERAKILNHWAVMVNKRLKTENEGDPDDDDNDGGGNGEGSGGRKKGASGGGKGGGKGGKSGRSLQISDMDEWVDSDEDDDDDSDDDKKAGKKDDDDDEDSGKKKSQSRDAKNKGGKKSKKKGSNVDDEAFEDSDDGDDEGREMDYMSDESSEDEEEINEQISQKGVDQDEGLAKMLDSESSDDDDSKKDDDSDDDEDESGKKKGKKGKKAAAGSGEGDGAQGANDASGNPNSAGNAGEASSGMEASGDGSASGGGAASSSGSGPGGAAGTSSSSSSSAVKESKVARAEKRREMVNSLLDPNRGSSKGPSAKRSRMDLGGASSGSGAGGGSSAAGGSAEAMFEEDVRRYLARKPMTTTEILKKIKSKKTGLLKDELMPLLVSVLKRINPHKQKVKGIMYLSLKPK